MGWGKKTKEEQNKADSLRKEEILATLDSPVGHCGAQSRAFVRDGSGQPVSACPWPVIINDLLDKILALEHALDAERRKNS